MGRRRRKIVQVRVAGQRRGISGIWWGAIQSGGSSTLLNRIWLYMILYAVYAIFCIYRSSRGNYLSPSEGSWRQMPNRLNAIYSINCASVPSIYLMLYFSHVECNLKVLHFFSSHIFPLFPSIFEECNIIFDKWIYWDLFETQT